MPNPTYRIPVLLDPEIPRTDLEWLYEEYNRVPHDIHLYHHPYHEPIGTVIKAEVDRTGIMFLLCALSSPPLPNQAITVTVYGQGYPERILETYLVTNYDYDTFWPQPTGPI